MALESFRQLILDAQAMMDPDFAGKLSADIATEDDADTDFAFGATEPTPEQNQQVVEDLESATDFTFGSNDSQIPLLDPSHFSPFAEKKPTRPFLRMPNQTKESQASQTGVPQVSRLRPGIARSRSEAPTNR